MFDWVERPVTAASVDLVVAEVFRRRAREIIREHWAGGPRAEAEEDIALARAADQRGLFEKCSDPR